MVPPVDVVWLAEAATSARSTKSEYGYWLVVVYASQIHWRRPSTTAAYGSLSNWGNGAAFGTRWERSRLIMMRLSPWIRSEINRLTSRKCHANSARLKNPPIGIPPSPLYV